MAVFTTYRRHLGNDVYWNYVMNDDTWYGVTLMFRLLLLE